MILLIRWLYKRHQTRKQNNQVMLNNRKDVR
jgi:hypothetical protein